VEIILQKKLPQKWIRRIVVKTTIIQKKITTKVVEENAIILNAVALHLATVAPLLSMN